MDCDPPPRRVSIIGPSHTFEQRANAIDAAFARWELSHLHEFELSDGRRIGYPDHGYSPQLEWLDHAALKPARELAPGNEFSYVFDFGDDWRHRCRVLEEKVDPREVWGEPLPAAPAAVWGWGWIPDQHGRVSSGE